MRAGPISHPSCGENGQAIVLSKEEAAFIRAHLMNNFGWSECNEKNPESGSVLSLLYAALKAGRGPLNEPYENDPPEGTVPPLFNLDGK
jgi:hypothetical protein